MPTIPVYQPGQVRAASTPNIKVGVDASAASFGLNQARALGEFGQGIMSLGEMVQRQKEKQDTAIARDLLNKAQLEAQEAMQNGVYSKQGLDASNADEQARQSMQEIRQKYLGLAKGSKQQALFSASFDEMATSNVGHAMAYKLKEVKRGDEATLAAQNQLAIDRAVSMRNDPAEIARAEDTILRNTRSQYAGLGEATNLAARKAQEHFHSSVLDGYLGAGEDSQAEAYMMANKDKFDPLKVAEVQGKIETRKSQGAVLAMVNAGKGEAEIAEFIQTNTKDPTKADDLLRYAETFIAVQRRQAAAKMHQATEEAWGKVEASMDPNDIDPRLPREDRHKMQEYIKNGGKPAATNYEMFDKVMKLGADDLVKFAKTPGAMSDAKMNLGPKEFAAFNERVIDAYGGKIDAKQAKANKGFLSDQELGTSLYNARHAALDLGKKVDANRRGAFLLAFDKKLMEAQEAAGDKPLDMAAKEKIAAKLLLYGEWDPGVLTWGKNVFAFELDQQGLDRESWDGPKDQEDAPREIAGGRTVVVNGQEFRKKREDTPAIGKPGAVSPVGGGITIQGAK